MSFVQFAKQPLRTKEQVALEVHKVSLDRGLDELATAICLMAIDTEVGTDDANGERQWWCPWNTRCPGSYNYPNDSQSDDSRSVGYLQQQPGPNGEPWWGSVESMMTLSMAADQFLARLDDAYTTAADNPQLAGQFVQRVQDSAFPSRYQQSWDLAWSVLNAALAGQQPAPTPAPAPAPIPAPEPAQPPEEAPVADKPDFNEFPLWTQNNQSRGGQTPTLVLLHTQQPSPTVDHGPPANDAAEGLGRFCANPATQVSYHTYIGQASDGGVTVVDGVDTDLASWSVGDANDYSINYCFGGSFSEWTRDEWLRYEGNAIDVAAYLAVQDCKKYGIPTTILGFGGNYPVHGAGISDHRYVTDVIGWGTHQDVGPNFPGDVFAAAVAKYANDQAPAPVPAPAPAPTPEEPVDPLDAFESWLKGTATDRELLEYIAAQLGPGDPSWASKGKTLRDEVFGV